MGLRVQTQVYGNAFILHCEGRIVFGDEGAALRESAQDCVQHDSTLL